MSETRRRSPLCNLVLAGLLIVGLFLALPLANSHASSSLVQENNAGCGIAAPATSICTSGTTIQVPFSTPVSSGDVAVVALAIDGAPVTSVTDSLGSTFTQAASEGLTGGSYSNAGVLLYYATLSSSGSDAVTVALSFPPGESADVFVFELSGVTVAGAATASSSGSTTSVSAASTSYASGGFALSVIQASSPTTATAGSGFTLVNPASGTGQGFTEYLLPGSASSTTFPATLGASAGSWAEAGIVLAPTAPAKVPVSLTLSPDSHSTAVNSTNYFTVSYSSGGSPATAEYTGTALSLQADSNTNIQISATTSSSGPKVEWCLSASVSSCQQTTFGTGSSGATVAYVYYELFTEAVSYSLLGGGSYTPGQPPQAPSISYTTSPATPGSSDSPSTLGQPGLGGQVLPNSPAFDLHVLKGTTASVNELLGGAGPGERWVLSSSSASLVTANGVPVGQWVVTKADQVDDPMQFQHQYQVDFASNPSSGGTTSPSGVPVWEDAGASVPISATAGPGNLFNGWSSTDTAITFGNPSSASTTATIGGSGTITASFAGSTVYANLMEPIGVVDAYAPAASSSLSVPLTVNDQSSPGAASVSSLSESLRVSDAYSPTATATIAEGLQVSGAYAPAATASLTEGIGVLDQTPGLAISPVFGAAGTVVALSGTGYSPGLAYSYCFSASEAACPGGSPAFTATLADPGAIPPGTTLTFPSLGPGSYFVVVSSGSAVATSVPFTVAPRVASLTPSSGPAGTSTGVSGTGFLPGATYAYCVSSQLAPCAPLGTVTAGADGSISFSLTVPGGTAPAGPYLVIIETTGAQPTVEASFDHFTVTATVTSAVTTTGGGATVDDASVTGTTVAITGSSAANGTPLTVNSTVLGSQPSGTSGALLTPAGYYDVRVTGISTGTALICISNPQFTQDSLMQYWTGSQWADASGMTFTQPDTLCGSIPVADLTGTPILVGAQSVTVTFSASGLGTDAEGAVLTVDGVSYPSSQLPLAFTWTAGSQHSYSWSATVASVEAGARYSWGSTTGGVVTGPSGTFAVPSGGGAIDAAFVSQYYLTVAVSGSGTVTPSSGWFEGGSSVTLTPSASAGYAFSSWTGSGTGSITGTAVTAALTMDGPITETASFAPSSPALQRYSVTFDESGLPAGTPWQVTFEGVTLSSSTSTVTFAGISPGRGGWNASAVEGTSPGVRYRPSVGLGSLDVPSTVTADISFTTQYLVTFSVSPPGSGSTIPALGPSWYDAGASVQLSAAPAVGYVFVSWSSSAGIAIATPSSPASAATVSSYGAVTAFFVSTGASCTSSGAESCQAHLVGGALTMSEPSTGVTVEISGSSSPAGTLVTVTTTPGTATLPPGVATPSLSDAVYYDVMVGGLTDGTARVCFSLQGSPFPSLAEYWNGGSWTPAGDVSAAGGSVCGSVPVSALLGTPFAVGSPAAVATTTTSTANPTTTAASTATSAYRATSTTSSGTPAAGPGWPGFGFGLDLAAVAVAVAVIAGLVVRKGRQK